MSDREVAGLGKCSALPYQVLLVYQHCSALANGDLRLRFFFLSL